MVRALGAVVVGIGAYPGGAEAHGAPPLQFAAADAAAVATYLRICWPEAGRSIIRHVEETEATQATLASVFRDLGAEGPFDLLFVYLSGHGLAAPDRAAFLVQPSDDRPVPDELSAETLDALIGGISARRTIFILDCCFAEAVVARMPMFRTLDGSEARLFIASSRADQRTWEDERAGHGVFTAHLIDLLNTGSAAQLPGARDEVQVDGELFPFLCSQLPLYVLEHKSAHQEPVKGGVAAGVVSLPVARAARRLRDRSTLGTALRRVRQILAGGAAAAVGAMALAYLFMWHPEMDGAGEVILRNGPRWLQPAFQYLPDARVATGIWLDDLASDPAARQALQSGALTGVWTQMTREGYRGWYEAIRPGLEPMARRALDAFADAPQDPRPDGAPEDAPTDVVAQLARGLLSTPDAATLEWVLKAAPGADRLSPMVEPFNARAFDFTVLDRPTVQMTNYASALQATAIIDPDRTLYAYIGFLKATQEWLEHNSDAQRGSGAREAVAEAAAAVLPVIAAANEDRGRPSIDPVALRTLEALAANGYADTAGRALARAPGLVSGQKAALAGALRRFHGDAIGDDGQRFALQDLAASLNSSPASQSAVRRTLEIFAAAGRNSDTFRTKFLIDAADHRALPPDVLAEEVAKARSLLAQDDVGFEGQETARVLAHAMQAVPTADRATVYALVDRVASQITPRSGTLAEIYGALARQRLDRPDLIAKVVAQTEGLPQSAGQGSEARPGITIGVGGPSWAAALAQFGNRPLDARARAALRRFADHPDVGAQVRAALAAQADGEGLSCDARTCRGLPAREPRDSRTRIVEAELAALHLARLPTPAFRQSLTTLRNLRSVEVEPEYRIVLGRLIVAGQLARVTPSLEIPPER